MRGVAILRGQLDTGEMGRAIMAWQAKREDAGFEALRPVASLPEA